MGNSLPSLGFAQGSPSLDGTQFSDTGRSCGGNGSSLRFYPAACRLPHSCLHQLLFLRVCALQQSSHHGKTVR